MSRASETNPAQAERDEKRLGESAIAGRQEGRHRTGIKVSRSQGETQGAAGKETGMGRLPADLLPSRFAVNGRAAGARTGVAAPSSALLAFKTGTLRQNHPTPQLNSVTTGKSASQFPCVRVALTRPAPSRPCVYIFA